MSEYTIYSKWLALELRKQHHKLLRTGVNENFPQYNTYIFANSEELQEAISKLTKKHK